MNYNKHHMTIVLSFNTDAEATAFIGKFHQWAKDKPALEANIPNFVKEAVKGYMEKRV